MNAPYDPIKAAEYRREYRQRPHVIAARKREHQEYYAKNKDAVLEKNRLWNKNNPEALKLQQRAYAESHRDLLNARRRGYGATEKGKASAIDWRRRNYWRTRFYEQLKRAREVKAEIVSITSLRVYYHQVFTRESEVCQYCRGSFAIKDITIDHKQPHALGGKHEVSNLAVSCLDCNLKKGIKPFETWIAFKEAL